MTLPTTLPPLWPVALALLGFGALGFRRGWVRELATLGGLLLSWLVLALFGLRLVGWANKLGLIAAFTWRGGFDLADPAPLMGALRAQPAIDPWRPELFHLALFAIGAAAAYAAGGRLAAGPRATADAILGALAGALNGYVLAYVLLDYLRIGPRLPGTLGPMAGDAVGVLGRHVATVAIAVVVGAVAIALLTGRRGAGLGSRKAGRTGG
ncbi:MAG TPA: hypothetical protein VG370_22100 [Chloroflexota bacterium]|jgi:hypothetical protein|nr:hypothetical protein [Chloroflexota bacterium]